MKITATLTFFFDTIFFAKMSTNSTFTMCIHTYITTLSDITKTNFHQLCITLNIANQK